MRIKEKKVKKIFESKKEVAVYGIGEYGQKLIPSLIEKGYYPRYIVVSRKDVEVDDYKGIPIIEVSELFNKPVIVLIAVSTKFQDEIIQELKKNNLDEYYTWDSYVCSSIFNDENQKLLYSSREDSADFQNWTRSFAVSKKQESGKCKKIGIILSEFSSRAEKIMEALKLEKQEVIVFVPYYSFIKQECSLDSLYKAYEVYEPETIKELVNEIIKTQIDVVHIFSNAYISQFDELIIRTCKALECCAVVYDEYDIVNKLYPNVERKYWEAEWNCLNEADGVCNRGFELEFFSSQGYLFNNNWIHFYDFCGNNFFSNTNNNKLDGNLSFVYVGGISSEKNKEVTVFSWNAFANICKENECFFHIYPSTTNSELLEEYREYARENDHLIIHPMISSDKLAEEISAYDYGIFPIISNFMEADISESYYKEKYIYATTNKYFDYLQAGLPIISPHPVRMADDFADQGVWIRWGIDQYDFSYLRENKNVLKQKVKEKQSSYSINRNIYKLITFYNELGLK